MHNGDIRVRRLLLDVMIFDKLQRIPDSSVEFTFNLIACEFRKLVRQFVRFLNPWKKLFSFTGSVIHLILIVIVPDRTDGRHLGNLRRFKEGQQEDVIFSSRRTVPLSSRTFHLSAKINHGIVILLIVFESCGG